MKNCIVIILLCLLNVMAKNSNIMNCTVDTLFSINFKNDNCFSDSQGIRDLSRLRFTIDNKMNVYIYDLFSNILSKRTMTGEILKCKKINFDLVCMGIHKSKLYFFDGFFQHVYSLDNLDYIDCIKILSQKEKIRVSGISFYYNKYLVVGDFYISNTLPRYFYIYDIEKRKLSKKADVDKGIIPIVNCLNCDKELLNKLYLGMSKFSQKYYNLYSQTKDLILFSETEYLKKERKIKKKFFLHQKETGNNLRIPCIERLDLVGASKDVIFINNNSFMIQCLYQCKEGNRLLPSSIMYCLIKW